MPMKSADGYQFNHLTISRTICTLIFALKSGVLEAAWCRPRAQSNTPVAQDVARDEIPRLWLKPIMMFHILVLCWQLASAFEVPWFAPKHAQTPQTQVVTSLPRFWTWVHHVLAHSPSTQRSIFWASWT